MHTGRMEFIPTVLSQQGDSRHSLQQLGLECGMWFHSKATPGSSGRMGLLVSLNHVDLSENLDLALLGPILRYAWSSFSSWSMFSSWDTCGLLHCGSTDGSEECMSPWHQNGSMVNVDKSPPHIELVWEVSWKFHCKLRRCARGTVVILIPATHVHRQRRHQYPGLIFDYTIFIEEKIA